jgi:RNA polymerase sigma-70 factor (ECF subfamily)
LDAQTFEGLIDRYADRVYSVALRITGSPEDAADAVQDAFLSAYEHRDAFRGESTASTWLYRIAVNAALQRVRIRRPTEYLELPADEDAEIVDWSEDVPRRVEASELREMLERGIAHLPVNERVAFVLRDVQGLSTAEAAAVLELTEAALKSRLHRARVLLRQFLADYLAMG